MIQAAKHINLNTCLLRAASRLLTRLQEDRVCRYSKLLGSLADFGDDANAIFLPTVNFLFLMGRVQYHPQTDSFEYLQPATLSRK
jgi:hypothetical protein